MATPFAVGLEHMSTQWRSLALTVLVLVGLVAGEARDVGNRAEHDQERDAGDEAGHHRVGDEADQPPEPKQPEAEVERAYQRHQRHQRAFAMREQAFANDRATS